MLATVCFMAAESEQNAAQGAKERQVQAEEEARLALLTSQAGMKLTLTDKVIVITMDIRLVVACTFLHKRGVYGPSLILLGHFVLKKRFADAQISVLDATLSDQIAF